MRKSLTIIILVIVIIAANSKDNNWADDGRGGLGYAFSDEVTPSDRLMRGTVAMANAGQTLMEASFL